LDNLYIITAIKKRVEVNMQQATSQHTVDLGGDIKRILMVSHSIGGKRHIAEVRATGSMDFVRPALHEMFVAPVIESEKFLKRKRFS